MLATQTQLRVLGRRHAVNRPFRAEFEKRRGKLNPGAETLRKPPEMKTRKPMGLGIEV